MSQARDKGMTVAEYLAFERSAEGKHEYYRGQLFAMAGASRAHNQIVANVLGEMRALLRERPCEVYASDMRVRVADTGLYAYPDATAVYGGPQVDGEHQDILVNPQLIVEVLSPSTEAYDRGKKFALYRAIPSLVDYLLVAQDRRLVDHYVRQADGTWNLRTLRSGERVTIVSLACELSVDELYLKVELENRDAPAA